MKTLRLILSLLFFVPACTVLGAFSTLDSRLPLWWGMTLGAGIGVFFGLVFGGNPDWKVWDSIFGPKDRNAAKDD